MLLVVAASSLASLRAGAMSKEAPPLGWVPGSALSPPSCAPTARLAVSVSCRMAQHDILSCTVTEARVLAAHARDGNLPYSPSRCVCMQHAGRQC